jgi:hypothetical protein
MGYMRLEIERLKAESAARLEALQLIASGQRANGQTVGPMHAYQMQNVARAEIDKAKGES